MLHFQAVCIISVKYSYKYRLQGSIFLSTRSSSILRDEHGWEQPDLVMIPELSPLPAHTLFTTEEFFFFFFLMFVSVCNNYD